ncbi:MAG TPA: VTT domain-containing protein [Patescibacteria group bacterium]|nr:VTT domain-containing protein [Patescibacteria group bacterium]
MHETLQFLSRHGYAVIFAWVCAEQAGVPVPAIPMLLAAGALAGAGRMNPVAAAGLAVIGSLVSDSLWFSLGRTRGIRVLKLLCRISLEPDSCVRNTQGVFAKHGARTLLAAKFVPGLGAAAAPLAGVVRMPLWRFLLFDTLGASLWASAYVTAGFVFSDQLEVVVMRGGRLGADFLALMAVACAAFIAWKFTRRRRFLAELRQARITPEELHDMIQNGRDVVVVDLRHLLSVEADPELIPGAKWIDPENLRAQTEALPRDREVILYCA